MLSELAYFRPWRGEKLHSCAGALYSHMVNGVSEKAEDEG